MAKILHDILPQSGKEYSPRWANELIRKLQQALGIKVQTEDDTDEVEAINFFLSN